MTSSPAITVLMPAYNAGKYIAEAIRSVLAQSFVDFELLIIDDGSTDDTVIEINKFKDNRIRLIQCEHKGVALTLNSGLSLAVGDYIARFDADDVCYPERLSVQHEFMQAHPDYILIGSEEDYIDVNSQYIFTSKYTAYSDEEIRSLPSSVCPFSHVSVMYRRQDVLDAGAYDNNAHTFEDHLLWLKLIQKGKVCNLRHPLVKYRFNPESITIDEKWRGKAFIELKYACLRKGFITQEEGDRLRQIVRAQEFSKLKRGAYYSLIAKKYLWDNYHPARARAYLSKLIKYYPARPGTYFLYLASFLPRNIISLLYKSRPKNKG
jgi:glycosyltransferase involved in cell wall biosynthesis